MSCAVRSPNCMPLWCAAALALLAGCPDPSPIVLAQCDLTPADWAVVEGPGRSFTGARLLDELALHLIRKDLPRPTVHARSLFHLSAAMFDAWAAYDPVAKGVFFNEKHLTSATDAARFEAVVHAGARVLRQRYAAGAGGAQPVACIGEALSRAGLDPNDTGTQGDGPAAVGNRAGQAVLDFGANDGANEANNYADTTDFVAPNDPLVPSSPGTTMRAPNLWQPLQLQSSVSQNGIVVDGLQKFVGAHWLMVTPFAMSRAVGQSLYHDPGPLPAQGSDDMRNRFIAEVLTKQASLATSATSTLDVSPGAYGNNSLGANDGHGRPQNPVTGQPYPAQTVPVSDFGRVLAEFWADGPNSETPPGHWNVLANQVSNAPGFSRQLGGTGTALGALEWDVKLYLALNGALHDAAISAWEVKRNYYTARPISLVRYLAGTDPRGLPLTPAVVERRNGVVQVRSWQPQAGVGWRDPAYWVPYQKPTFVTPAFPGFISGHSTFSRAAAEVLTDLTGSNYFPGGLGEFVARPGFLSFEDGPSMEVRLQWATYQDAADQAGQSRIWGGIHLEPDDLAGRRVGHDVGVAAAALARRFYSGQGR